MKHSLVEKILNEKSFSMYDSQEIEEIKSHLTPLIDYMINLNLMDGKEIKRVEPFNDFLKGLVMLIVPMH